MNFIVQVSYSKIFSTDTPIIPEFDVPLLSDYNILAVEVVDLWRAFDTFDSNDFFS